MAQAVNDSARPAPKWRRFLPLAVLLLGMAAFFALGLDKYATVDMLRQHRATLVGWVEARPLLAPLAYIAAYATVAALSLPAGAPLSIVGGFLFGAIFGTVWVVIGATVGATLLFIAARTAFADLLRAKAGPAVRRMEAGFRANAFSYLLSLRFLPVFPFWLVNLAAALLDVPLRVFVLATFLGIIPGSFVFVNVGSGLGAVLDSGEPITVMSVLTPKIMIALSLLALLSLAPALLRRFKGKRGG